MFAFAGIRTVSERLSLEVTRRGRKRWFMSTAWVVADARQQHRTRDRPVAARALHAQPCALAPGQPLGRAL